MKTDLHRIQKDQTSLLRGEYNNSYLSPGREHPEEIKEKHNIGRIIGANKINERGRITTQHNTTTLRTRTIRSSNLHTDNGQKEERMKESGRLRSRRTREEEQRMQSTTSYSDRYITDAHFNDRAT